MARIVASSDSGKAHGGLSGRGDAMARCRECGADNPPSNAFCGKCGVALITAPPEPVPVIEPHAYPPPEDWGKARRVRCPHCGRVNAAGNRHCDQCTTELTARGRVRPKPDHERQMRLAGRFLMAAMAGLVLVIILLAVSGQSATQNGVVVATSTVGAGVSSGAAVSRGAAPAPTVLPTAGTSATLGNFDGYVGALAQEIRICGLAAHQLTWHHTDISLESVFPAAATARGGCNFAADNISYDSVPDGLDGLGVNSAAVDTARHKLEAWARLLAHAYAGSDYVPSMTLMNQAEESKVAGLTVIVAAAQKLGRPLDAATLLPRGTSWND